jgi:hypothetical protein
MPLPPGAWSSQRHWHAKEDEFIYVVLFGASLQRKFKRFRVCPPRPPYTARMW